MSSPCPFHLPTVLQASVIRRAMARGETRKGGWRDVRAQSVRDLWNSLLAPKKGREKKIITVKHSNPCSFPGSKDDHPRSRRGP